MSDSVVEIEPYAFVGCENLSEVKFSNNLQKIGQSAFQMCSLETIVYPASIQQIDSYAFFRNDVKSVVFLPGRTTIPKGACDFSFGNTLEELVIPEGVKTIEEYAFQYFNVSTVTLPSSLEKIEKYAFEGVNADTINYNGTVAQYSNIIEGITGGSDFTLGPVNCTDGVFNSRL